MSQMLKKFVAAAAIMGTVALAGDAMAWGNYNKPTPPASKATAISGSYTSTNVFAAGGNATNINGICVSPDVNVISGAIAVSPVRIDNKLSSGGSSSKPHPR